MDDDDDDGNSHGGKGNRIRKGKTGRSQTKSLNINLKKKFGINSRRIISLGSTARTSQKVPSSFDIHRNDKRRMEHLVKSLANKRDED